MTATKLEVLQDLQTTLQTIKISNQFLTDIGKNVSYWDTYNNDYKGSPTVTFRDKETDYERKGLAYQARMLVEIEAIGYVRESTKLVDSCNVCTDLLKAVVLNQWSDNVIAVRLKQDSKEIEAKGKQAISVMFRIEIEYRENILS